MYRRALLAATILSGLTVTLHAQINGHAQVTAIAGNTITLGTVDETYGSFEDGDRAILMQMQDDVAGPNLLNNFNFGNLSSISSAGFWERVTISAHAESGGLPISIDIVAPTTHVYHFGPKCSVQLITFPDRGTPDFTTTAPINALPWNGVIGGVVALQVSGVLTLAHDIRADGAGFRGGAPSANYNGTCTPGTYTSSVSNYGEKGDGVQRVDLVNYRYARGKLITAGGGGNPRNAGGGGGGNITGGGAGGGGYGCFAGGFPGFSLSPYIWLDRFFMGGAGGGGQQNNSVGGAGGAGGGIVIVQMETLRTVGPCSGLYISANGADGASSIGAPPDGAGGGGAGGSIYLEVNSFEIDASCSVTCQANGGNGGTVTNTNPSPGNWVDCGGGGGGGGQGLVMCGPGMGGSGGSGWAGMSGQTSSGSGGTHDPAGGHAPDGFGIDGLGVVGFAGGPALPVELLYFEGHPLVDEVRLDWSTATEHNSAFFRIQRSLDGEAWTTIAEVPAAGESQETLWYTTSDRSPVSGLTYYSLEQIDLDDRATPYPAIAVEWTDNEPISVYPNPADGTLTLLNANEGPLTVTILDATGREVLRTSLAASERTIPTNGIVPGTYTLVISGRAGDPVRRTVLIQR